MISLILAKKITFSGIVQGVFFRDFVKKNADKLGVCGYVKNLENGKVEAVFEGEEERVKGLIEICKKGPVRGRVDEIKTEETQTHGYRNFMILL